MVRSRSMGGKWLTTTEVGEELGRTRQAVLVMLEDERFEHFPGAWRTVGGHWRIPRASVLAYLARRQEAASRVHRRRKS